MGIEQNGSLAARKHYKMNRMYKSVNNIIDYAERHDLGGIVTVHFDLHKAHAGERITTPHLNPDIWEIEKQFFALLDSKKVISEILTGLGIEHPLIVKSLGGYSLQKAITNKIQKINGEALTEKEFHSLKDLIMKALDVPAAKVEALIIKAAAVAKIGNIDFMGKPVKIDLKGLPTNLKAAIKRGIFTVQEVRTLKFAFQYAGINISAVTNRAQARISNMVVESIQNKEHPRRLASRMFDEMAIGDDAVLNRDWERVAITETNRSANDAIIAGHADGEYVLGNSHVDACQYCMKYIDKKVYRVTTHPPENPSNYKPGSAKYIEQSIRWDTEIWVGKSNMGRSLAARRRTPKGLVPRKHHELGTPVIPLHPTCLPGDSLVSPRGEITNATKRWFDGYMTIIKCASGRELICTPNHSILAGIGFVPANSLNVGGTVISDGISERPLLSDWDHINKPSRIEDIVESFLNSSEVTSVPVPVSPEDFHGDGVGSKVAIIGTNRLLGSSINPSDRKHLPKYNFIFARNLSGLLNRLSNFRSLIKRYYSTLRGFMSRLDLFTTLAIRHIIPLDYFRFRLATEFNTSHNEPISNNRPGYSELFGQSINGKSTDVKINDFSDREIKPNTIDRILAGKIISGSKGSFFNDCITHIETKSFHGYVYNIETTEGYYIANGITTHNCRCRWSTWLPEIYYLKERTVMREGRKVKEWRVEFAVDEKSKAEYAEFLKKNPHILKGATT